MWIRATALCTLLIGWFPALDAGPLAQAPPGQLKKLVSFADGNADLYAWTDTANIYVLRDGDRALLFDLGDGSVLGKLAGIGVRTVEWVLFTHHHREQVQGSPLLAKWHPRIGAPEAERAFFETPSAWRKMKPSLSDSFAVHGSSYVRPPIHAIRIDRAFAKMDDFTWHGHTIRCIETKGNSPGGMTYLLHHTKGWIAISGDVMLDGARMHNWFDTEWDYGFGAGIYALVESAALIERYDPFMMLPSHGPAIGNPKAQLAEFELKLRQLEPLYLRGYSVMQFWVPIRIVYPRQRTFLMCGRSRPICTSSRDQASFQTST